MKKLHKTSPDAADLTSNLGTSSDEDIYILSTGPAASELSSTSGTKVDDNGNNDIVDAIIAHTKAMAVHYHTSGPTKWDTKVKHTCYLEKYDNMTPKAALGEFVQYSLIAYAL